jgi:hypothetical protein
MIKKKYIHVDKIESVQKRATKQTPGFNNLSYPERLKKLKLPTMAYRRIRGDMIETYKIIAECSMYLCVYVHMFTFFRVEFQKPYIVTPFF